MKGKIKKNAAGMYETDIDGKTYEFSKWGAEDSVDALIDIGGLVGGPIGNAIGSIAGGEGMDKEFKPEMVGLILESLTKNLSGNKAISKALIKKMASQDVMCEGKSINFNDHYSDSLPHLFKVVRAAFEVQYGNFFDALQDFIPKKPSQPKTQGIGNHE